MERDTKIYSEGQVQNALVKAGVRISGDTSTHLLVFCEFHSNYNTASAEVDKETGQFYCFSCRYTCQLSDLIERRGYTYFQAMRIIGDSEYDIVEELDKMFKVRNDPPEFDSNVVRQLHEDVDGGRDYFHSRFITDESIDKFELGYSAKQEMVVVPVHSPWGVLWGFVGRSIEGKRFKNSTGLQKSKTLFNIHRVWAKPSVYVVESTFDAIRLDQVGIPAVATLGAGISDEQVDLLFKTFDDIVVIPDNDDAGKVMTAKILKSIPHAMILPLEGAKDVGDLTDAQIRDIV